MEERSLECFFVCEDTNQFFDVCLVRKTFVLVRRARGNKRAGFLRVVNDNLAASTLGLRLNAN